MQSLPQEFLALCRQLGDAQQRCSAAMQAQARQIEALMKGVEKTTTNTVRKIET